MAQEADTFYVSQATDIVPDGARIGEFLLDGHILHPSVALAVPVEVEADGGDARVSQFSRERRHRVDALVGEDSVHQDHHRTVVFGRIEPFGQRDFVVNVAFRPFYGRLYRSFSFGSAISHKAKEACQNQEQENEDLFHRFGIVGEYKFAAKIQKTRFSAVLSQNQ